MINLIGFTGLLFIARLLHFANLIVNRGVESSQILMVFISIIPTFLEIALPMSVLLGIMMAFARLSGDSELVVCRASGISLRELVKPVVLFGIAATLISSYVSIELRPWGYHRLNQTLFEIARSRSSAGLEPGFFNRLGHLTLYAEEIDHLSGKINRVLIDDQRDSERRQIIVAQRGEIYSNAEDRTISITLNDGVAHEQNLGKYVLTDFSVNRLIMNSDEIFNPEARERGKRDRERSLTEIAEQIDLFKNNLSELNEEWLALLADGPAPSAERLESTEDAISLYHRQLAELRVERARRFSMPFAALLFALIAMPLGVQPPRAQKAWGPAIAVVLALIVFLTYYSTLTISITMAEEGYIDANLAVWFPNLVMAGLVWLTHHKMISEKWQSIAHGVEEFLEAISRFFPKRRGE